MPTTSTRRCGLLWPLAALLLALLARPAIAPFGAAR
jgi:hypothetical protein